MYDLLAGEPVGDVLVMYRAESKNMAQSQALTVITCGCVVYPSLRECEKGELK